MKAKKNMQRAEPVIRARVIVGAMVVVGVLVVGPLFAVWKQVHIRNQAIRKESLSAVLSDKRSEVTKLQLTIETLSKSERIESIGLTRLGLVYPVSAQIVVVRPQPSRSAMATMLAQWDFFAVLRKSLVRDRG
jgi:cell division protein FtsL